MVTGDGKCRGTNSNNWDFNCVFIAILQIEKKSILVSKLKSCGMIDMFSSLLEPQFPQKVGETALNSDYTLSQENCEIFRDL